MLRGLFYGLVGPTTVHLEYEFYLFCSLFLLTVSSLQGLYKDSFGTTHGDFMFLGFQFLWLSKHLVLRMLCVWDSSTSASPTLRGFCSHFITSYLTGGQVFDRPTPKTLARQIGTDTRQGSRDSNIFHASGSTSMAQLPATLEYLVQIVKVRFWFPLASIFDPPPYAHVQRRRLQQQRYLLGQQQPGNHNSSGTSGSSSRSSSHASEGQSRSTSRSGGTAAATTSLRRMLHTIAFYTSIMWNNAPSFQLCLVWSATAFLCYLFFYDLLQEQPMGPSALYNSGYNTQVKQEEDSMKRSGYYRPKMTIPTDLSSLFTLNVQMALLLTLAYFSRVILPIPDQIAGGNILKDARQEAKAPPKQSWLSGSSSSGGSSGAGGFFTSLLNKWFYPTSGSSHGGGSSSSRKSSDHPHAYNTAELPWTERSRPIVTKSRWRVHALVLSIRLVDIWLACGILPRTNAACFIMGHCPTTARDPSVADMAHFLYPIGVVKALREDSGFNPASAASGTSIAAAYHTGGGVGAAGAHNTNHGWMSFCYTWMTSWWWSSPIAEALTGQTQINDSFSAAWVAVDLVIIPLVLLCSQALLLNRSYLAMASYFSTEWTWIGPERSDGSTTTTGSSSRSSASNQQQQVANATVWDPRRKYKKDDVVVHGKNLYRAAFDQPEGRPSDEATAMPLILRIFCLVIFVITGGGLFGKTKGSEGGSKKSRGGSSMGIMRSANGSLQNALRNELGHPATSDVICKGSFLLLALTVAHLIAWLWCTMWNLQSADGLFCAVVANMIACYAVVSVGSTKYQELNQLNREILAAAE